MSAQAAVEKASNGTRFARIAAPSMCWVGGHPPGRLSPEHRRLRPNPDPCPNSLPGMCRSYRSATLRGVKGVALLPRTPGQFCSKLFGDLKPVPPRLANVLIKDE